MWAAMQQTTGCSLMRFFTDIERESLGVICPRVLATGTSYTSALTDGRRAAFSIGFSSYCLGGMTRGIPRWVRVSTNGSASVRRSLPGNGTESNAEHRSMIRSLALFWGFPNQLSSDSWVVGFEEADHAADNRLFVDAVLYRYRTGVPWRDLPARFGDWNIVYQRFNRWAKSGVFDRIFKLLASDADNEYMMIDASIVRAHQHSAGARKKTARKRSADRAAD